MLKAIIVKNISGIQDKSRGWIRIKIDSEELPKYFICDVVIANVKERPKGFNIEVDGDKINLVLEK